MVDGFLGGWKLSGILTFTTGRPITVTAPLATFNKYTTGQTPDVSGALPKNTGSLQFDGNGACYFCGFKQASGPEPEEHRALAGRDQQPLRPARSGRRAC